MSGSRLKRFVEAVRVLQVHTERAAAKLASVPLLARERQARHLREANEAVDVARTRLLDTTTDETGPAPAVSAEQAAELAPDTRPSVAPTAAQAEAVGVARVEAAKPSALEQAAEALRASLELWSLGQQSRAERMIDRFGVGERSDSIQAEIRAALARIEADANAVATIGEIAEAERRGYAACQADVVAAIDDQISMTDADDRRFLSALNGVREEVTSSHHVGAAARAKGGG